jgi:hypothetical protein
MPHRQLGLVNPKAHLNSILASLGHTYWHLCAGVAQTGVLAHRVVRRLVEFSLLEVLQGWEGQGSGA